MYCLPPALAEKIKSAIKNGNLNPDKLNEMSSAERRAFLATIIGEENAKEVNLLFEQKSLLKNQEKAMYDWARGITGLSAEEKAKTLAKIRQTFVNKTKRIYDPAENEKFLNEITADVYSKKYKTEVSLEQAQKITELTQDVNLAKAKMKPDFTWETKQDGVDFGAKQVALNNYIGAVRATIPKEGIVNPFKVSGGGAKLSVLIENGRLSFTFIAENVRSIVASLDKSLWLRQGMRVLEDPRTTGIFVKDFAKSFKDDWQVIKGEIRKGMSAKDILLGRDAVRAGNAVFDGVNAEIYSRKNYLNGRFEANIKDGGAKGTRLDIGTGEEMFPTSLPEMIPVFGRFFKASDVDYSAGTMRLRVDVADKIYDIVEKTGADITNNKLVGDLNQVINEMTGRGHIGKGTGGIEKFVGSTFFSIKFAESNIEEILALPMLAGDINSPARRLRAENALWNITVTAILLLLARRLWPKDNKDNMKSTSSNFGKMRFGDMTFDLSHGAGGVVVTAAKIITQSSTSGATGITTKLNSGYGSQTGMGVFWQFTENKFAPMASVIKDIIDQQTFVGRKPTVKSEILSLITPISIQNITQFRNEKLAMRLIGSIADGLGINVSSYTASTDWGESTSQELTQFKAKVGDTKFKEANDKFNQTYNTWFAGITSNPKYTALTDVQKQTIITNKKSDIKALIFRNYGFRYVPAKKKPLPRL